MAPSKKSRNLAAERASKGLPKLTITRFEALPANERKSKAERIRKLREGGTPWPEIVAATGIPGGITGRKILRLYFGAKGSALVAPSYDRSKAEANRAKAARAARPKAAKADRAKAIPTAKGGAGSNAKGGAKLAVATRKDGSKVAVPLREGTSAKDAAKVARALARS